ncbi:MAG: helix-turn-helix transcriptional regulator [Flavisolibacter sp.]|nr:helix-turn-helix transcriptional regulator [Flavisolibacter sp.]
MTLHDFGSRVKEIREKVLKIKQEELAKELGIAQALMSRLELGMGGNITLVFGIVTYFDKKGFPGHLLFRENFSIEEFSLIASKLPSTQNAKKVIKKLQSSLNECIKNSIQLENIIHK